MSAALEEIGARPTEAGLTLAQAAALHQVVANARRVAGLAGKQVLATEFLVARPHGVHAATMDALTARGLLLAVPIPRPRRKGKPPPAPIMRWRLTRAALDLVEGRAPATPAPGGEAPHG
jgi:hypothetical protein